MVFNRILCVWNKIQDGVSTLRVQSVLKALFFRGFSSSHSWQKWQITFYCSHINYNKLLHSFQPLHTQVLPTYICSKHMLIKKKKKKIRSCTATTPSSQDWWSDVGSRNAFSFLEIQQPRAEEHWALRITPPLTGQLLLVGAAEGEWASRESSLGWQGGSPARWQAGSLPPLAQLRLSSSLWR